MFPPGLIFGDVSASNGPVPPASTKDAFVSETGEFAIFAFGSEGADRFDGPVPGSNPVPLPPPGTNSPDGGLGAVRITSAEGEELATPVDGKQSRPDLPAAAFLSAPTPDLIGGQPEHDPVAEIRDMDTSDTSVSKSTAFHSDDARQPFVSMLASQPSGAEMSENATPTRSNVQAVAEIADAEAQPAIPSETGDLIPRTGKRTPGERSEAAPPMSLESGIDPTDKVTRANPDEATMKDPRLLREKNVDMTKGAEAPAEKMRLSDVSRVAIPSARVEIPAQVPTEGPIPVSGAADRNVLQPDAVRTEPLARSVQPAPDRRESAGNTSQLSSVDSDAFVQSPSRARQFPTLSAPVSPPSERLESPDQPLFGMNPTMGVSVGFQKGTDTVIGKPERLVHLANSQPAHSSLVSDERFLDHPVSRDLSLTVSAKSEASALSPTPVRGIAASLVVEPLQNPRIDQRISDARRPVNPLADAEAPPKAIHMAPNQAAVITEVVPKLRQPSSAELFPDPMAVADGPHVLEMFSSEARLADVAQRSETSSTAPRAPELPRPAMNQLIDALRHAPGKVELTLSPDELGRVSLSLQIQDGTLGVLVHAERPETAELIRRNLDILLQEARADGFDDVTFAFGDQRDTGEDPRSQIASDWQDAPASIESEPILTGPRPFSPSDRLDIRL